MAPRCWRATTSGLRCYAAGTPGRPRCGLTMRFDITRYLGYAATAFGWTSTVQAAQNVSPALVALPWGGSGLGTVCALWGCLTRPAERRASASKRGDSFPLFVEAIQDLFA